MIAEILSTGNEVLSGSIIDSNSAYIAQKLLEIGIMVERHNCVGDDITHLVSIFKEIGNRSEIAIVTGGLGPTSDDLTSQAASLAAGVKLVLNDEAMSSLKAFFKFRNRSMTSSDNKQAILPESAKCIANPVGSAPGFYLKIGKCTFFFLPGVPSEMEDMLSNEVMDIIRLLINNNQKIFTISTINTFGLTEAAINEKLLEFNKYFPQVTLGFRADFPIIQIKFYASVEGENNERIEKLLQNCKKWISDKIGEYVFSLRGESMGKVVGDLLIKHNATLSLAESCTGGLLSNLITDVPGSSNYFLFDSVVYSNQTKINFLGVSSRTLEKYGAVHEETAREMALGVKRISGSTYGLSTTGIAGPDGGTEEKPVGTICIGVAAPDLVKGYRFNFSFDDRLKNKQIFAIMALDMLRKKLQIDSR